MVIAETILLLAAVLFCLLFPKRRRALSSELSLKHFYWISAALFLLALGLRLFRFTQVPLPLHIDETMAAYESYSLSLTGADRFGVHLPAHFEGWVYGQMSVLLSYLAVPFMWLLGPCTLAIRLPSLLLSMAGLWALWYLAKRAVSPRAALFVLGFSAIAPWHLLQSRWAIDCNLFPHLFLLGVLCLWLGAERGPRSGFYFLAMICFAASMYSYGVAYYVVPLFLLPAALWLIRRKKIRWGALLGCAGLFLLLSAPALLVIAVNLFGWDTISTPLFTATHFTQTQRLADMLFFSPNFFEQLWANLQSLFQTTVLQGHAAIPDNSVIPRYGTLYLCALPLTIFGGIRFFREQRKKPAAMLLGCWLAVAAAAGLLINHINVWRLNILWYPLLFLTGYGLYSLFLHTPALSAAVCAVLALELCLFCGYYFTDYNRDIRGEFYEGMTQAIRYPEEHHLEYDRIYLTGGVNQNPRVPQIAEVLVWWNHKLDPLYLRGERSEEGLLPYRERYQYVRMEDLELDPEENALYVANNKEVLLFDPALYDILSFDHCNLVIPKSRQPD